MSKKKLGDKRSGLVRRKVETEPVVDLDEDYDWEEKMRETILSQLERDREQALDILHHHCEYPRGAKLIRGGKGGPWEVLDPQTAKRLKSETYETISLFNLVSKEPDPDSLAAFAASSLDGINNSISAIAKYSTKEFEIFALAWNTRSAIANMDVEFIQAFEITAGRETRSGAKRGGEQKRIQARTEISARDQYLIDENSQLDRRLSKKARSEILEKKLEKNSNFPIALQIKADSISRKLPH